MELILIRHGETDYNREYRFQGHINSNLNDHGVQQANKLKSKISSERVGTIFSSDLDRCVETSKLLGFENIISNPNFRECNFGIWEGYTFDEIESKYPDQYNSWKNDLFNYKIENGESFKEVSKRVVSEIELLRTKFDGEKVVVVTHGGCIKIILSHYILDSDSQDPWKFYVKNCSITRVCFSDNYVYLKSLNEY